MSQQASTIYQTVILNHNRSPHGYGEMPLATHKADGFNPICGDRVTVLAIIEKEKFANLGFTAQSCALCRASASVMVGALTDLNLSRAAEFVAKFEDMIRGKTVTIDGDAAAFNAIKDYPARAKCVLLPWRTLTEAMQKGLVSAGTQANTISGTMLAPLVSTEVGE